MRRSLLKRVSATVCAVALTVAMATTCFAADKWETWLGQNKGWYEGALGDLSKQSANSWTLKLDSIGWMGVWGAQVKKTGLSIEKGKEYTLTFTLKSSDIDKWVFVKVTNDESTAPVLFGKWVQLKKGKATTVTEKVTLKEKGTQVVFGCGGEMGDRTDEEEIYKLTSTLPNDGDALYSTTLTCSNFSLDKASATKTTTSTKTDEGTNTADNSTGNTPATTDNTVGTTTTTTTSTTVQTGDYEPIACAAVAVIAAAAIVVFTRKREDA